MEESYHHGIFDALSTQDPVIAKLIEREFSRLNETVQLIAAENVASQATLAALGSVLNNKTTEGFPQKRFHGGCEVVDDIEDLAIARAMKAFGARYVNVQPHSGSQANQIVMLATLELGDSILGMDLDAGGHLTHGARVSVTSRLFKVHSYGVDSETKRLDYDHIRQLARTHNPKLIIAGASSYPRIIDFEKFRAIADEVGAYLLADISHISSLVAAGVHPSPIPHAHFTTTSTYKPGGPRGGLILMGNDADTVHPQKNKPLSKLVSHTTFPGFQGTPYLNNIAAKAVFFGEIETDEYQERQRQVVRNAKALAEFFSEKGYSLLTGGTDNHMVLIDVSTMGLTGVIAQEALEACGIVTNKNKIAYDQKSAAVTSGLRLGTPVVTKAGMKEKDMCALGEIIHTILTSITVESDTTYQLCHEIKENAASQVRKITKNFPVYPTSRC